MTTFSSCADLLAAITAQDGASGQEILNPATGEVVGVAPLNTAADAEAAVDRARAAQKDWDALGEEARNGLLLKLSLIHI